MKTLTVSLSLSSLPASLTFEQRKELILLESAAKEKIIQTQLEVEKQIELSRHQLEQKQLEVERYCSDLVKAGRLSDTGFSAGTVETPGFDVVKYLQLLPRFGERDVDRFFSLFERLADARAWHNVERTMLLQ